EQGRRDLERQAPEFLDARDTGDRLAGKPARRQGFDLNDFSSLQPPLSGPYEGCVVERERMADQDAGVAIRGLNPVVPEPARDIASRRMDAESRAVHAPL